MCPAWFVPVVSAAERLQRGDEICVARAASRGHARDGRQLSAARGCGMPARRSVRHKKGAPRVCLGVG